MHVMEAALCKHSCTAHHADFVCGCHAAVLKAAAPAVRVVGCQPAASDVMRRCVAARRILEHPSLPTLSDGTAGASRKRRRAGFRVQGLGA